MNKYRITLEGKTYEMEVELVSGNAAVQPAAPEAARPAQSTQAAFAARVTETPSRNTAANGAGAVTAPMPGTVLRILKNEGDTVKSGEVILVLEAMKMENEIAAPNDGVINVVVSEGAKINSGDTIAYIS